MSSFKAQLSFLKQPDGSCSIVNGETTTVWCSVNGPGDLATSKRILDKMNVSFSIKRIVGSFPLDVSKSNGSSSSSKSSSFWLDSPPSTSFVESVMREAIDVAAYPRTSLQVCAQEIKSDTPFESALLNGICLALLDAGLQMRYPFAALTVAKLPAFTDVAKSNSADNDTPAQFIVEPTKLRAAEATAIFLFVFRPSITAEGGGTVVASDAHGRFTPDDITAARKLAQRQCLAIFDLYRKCIFEKFAPYIVQ